MRVAVVDSRGVPLMPCTPPKARMLLKEGKAIPKRDKLGLFYIQLTYEQVPSNQPLVVGVDPGSKFEGFSVVGTQDTVINIMAEAPTHVKKAVETRRNMRRARRFRKWRREARFRNRNKNVKRLPPSTKARWQFKANIIKALLKTMPIVDAVVEDVQAKTRKGKGGQWNTSFSPIQVGKQWFYQALEDIGLKVWTREGWETKELRERFGLKKIQDKASKSFDSHCVDAWCLAAIVSGAKQPTTKQVWYLTSIRLHRRQLHMLRESKGGKRKAYGGTRSLGLKRGTLVIHDKYGLCSVGGCNAKKDEISLNTYIDNARLTQKAKVKDCRVLTTTLFRSYLVRKENDVSPYDLKILVSRHTIYDIKTKGVVN